MSSVCWGCMTPRTAAAAASCASLWRVILAIWQKQQGGCEECKRDGVERLPQQVCSVPPIRPLIGHGCSWGEDILPIGDNRCFVAGPSWPEQKPEIYWQQDCSSSLKRWHWTKKKKKGSLCHNILTNAKKVRKGKATNISFVNISHDLLLKNLILKLYNFRINMQAMFAAYRAQKYWSIDLIWLYISGLYDVRNMSCSPALLNRSCLVKQTLLIKSHPSVISGRLKPRGLQTSQLNAEKGGGGVKNPMSPVSSLENTILSKNMFLN